MTRSSVRFILLLTVTWWCSANVLGQLHEQGPVMEGHLTEPFWQSAKSLELKPSEKGVPEELAAIARVSGLGGCLYIGVAVPEPGGKVLAYSIGYNPKWEKNASTYFFDLDRLLPPTEDRMAIRIQFVEAGGVLCELKLEVNPWGALRVERNGVAVSNTSILSATLIDEEGWRIEIAIPIAELGLVASAKEVYVQLEQIRSRRPLAPEFRWQTTWNLEIPPTDSFEGQPRKPSPAVSEPELEVGRVQALPPLASGWEHPFWRAVPSLELSRNEPNPRRPRYPTEVKWAHDGRTLSFLFRCTEDTRVVCNLQQKDDRIETDDHVCVYFSTTGSSLVEILVNPTGAVKDQEGIRSNLYFNGIGEWRKIGYAGTNWSADVKTFPLITKDAWYARIDVPLDEVARALGSARVPDRCPPSPNRNV